MRRSSGSTIGGIVFKLSLKDLKHEWILTLCLIMAISAVLSPLLLLFGLKFGIIAWARDYLTQDPRYREIRPLTSKSFAPEWFEEMEQREDVAFIVPMTRQISATVKANVKGKTGSEQFNVIPTRPGDPLLLENGAAVPEPGECVLTKFAAEALGAAVGDVIEASAGRIVGSRYEYGTLEMRVAGILSLRASELKSVYVQLDILEAIEQYKDGQAVPELGWSGSTPKAYPLYDGLIIAMRAPLSKVEEYSLFNRTGFTKIETLDNAELKARAGFTVSSEMTVYRLYTQTKPAGEESIRNVENRLRGENAVIFPWIAPIGAELTDGAGNRISEIFLQGLSTAGKRPHAVGLSPAPDWKGADASDGMPLAVMLPEGIDVPDEEVFIRVAGEENLLTFPVSILPQRTDAEIAFVPERLAGILRLFGTRNIRYDETIGEFVLFRKGYAGFRLYARSIFDVDPLRRFFDAQALPVHTEINEIRKVIELDRGMTLIFWLLALVGIAGSVASLVASLYASVERKKREMSVLRLIGLSGPKLFRFPIYQGMLIGTGGFLASLVLFSIFSRMINSWFRPYVDKLLGFPMEAGVNFCRLPLLHMSIALMGTIAISALAAMIAAMRVTRIEPAEALRDE